MSFSYTILAHLFT